MKRYDELDEIGGGNKNKSALLAQMAAPGLPPPVDAPRAPVGGGFNPTPAPLDQSAPAAPKKYEGWGQYMPQGLDMAKVQGNVDDPKYQIARITSHFDPRKGLTPEVMEALSGLGIANFTGDSRDKLYAGGNTDPRFKDVLSSDIINNFGADNASWNGWGGTSVDPVAQPGAGGGGGMGAGGLHSLLTGNPNAGINAALGQYGGQSDFLQALLAQLGGQ